MPKSPGYPWGAIHPRKATNILSTKRTWKTTHHQHDTTTIVLLYNGVKVAHYSLSFSRTNGVCCQFRCHDIIIRGDASSQHDYKKGQRFSKVPLAFIKWKYTRKCPTVPNLLLAKTKRWAGWQREIAKTFVREEWESSSSSRVFSILTFLSPQWTICTIIAWVRDGASGDGRSVTNV